MSSNVYQVGYLASVSRLADHFYPMVYCLEGRDVIYKNPGTSIRSFVITQIQHELVPVSDEMVQSIKECEEFTSSIMVVKTIVELLIAKAQELIPTLKNEVEYATTLHKQAQIISTQFETIALQAAIDQHDQHFVHDNLVGQNFKQALINMKALIEAKP